VVTLNVLIVDDEEMVRLTLCQLLEREGHKIVTAVNGAEALAMLAVTDVDLVVTDMIMPDKDGVETIIAIRKRWPKLRILAISGGGRTRNLDFLKYAKSVGADAILPKPFNRAELIQAVADATA
jgi:Response regulator containing CheY-like receiver, AAA-type ATPase, and DNA-binding domains